MSGSLSFKLLHYVKAVFFKIFKMPYGPYMLVASFKDHGTSIYALMEADTSRISYLQVGR